MVLGFSRNLGKDSKLEIFIFCSDGLKFEINHHHHPFSLEDGLICEQQKFPKCFSRKIQIRNFTA